jgi:hypothetical protein
MEEVNANGSARETGEENGSDQECEHVGPDSWCADKL